MTDHQDDSKTFQIIIYDGGWLPTRYTYDSNGFTVGEADGTGIDWYYNVVSSNPRIYQAMYYMYSWRFLVASSNVHAGGPSIGETVQIQMHIAYSSGGDMRAFYQCDGVFSPWYTKDGVTWGRDLTSQWVYDDPQNPSTSGGTYTFWFTMTADYMQFSNFFPWDYWMNQAFTDTFVGLPCANVYNVHDSPHGRETRMVELTNPDTVTYPESSKKHIAMICRTHPAESCSSLVVEGLMNYIREHQGDLINKFHWYFVPVIEVDATMGQGMSGCGQMCNYHWGDNSVPVINAIRTILDAANSGAGMDCVFDMHSQGGSCGWTGILYINGHQPSTTIANDIHAQQSRYSPDNSLGTSCYGGGNNCSIWQYAYSHYHVNQGHCPGLATEVGQAQKSQSKTYINSDGGAFANALKNYFYP